MKITLDTALKSKLQYGLGCVLPLQSHSLIPHLMSKLSFFRILFPDKIVDMDLHSRLRAKTLQPIDSLRVATLFGLQSMDVIPHL